MDESTQEAVGFLARWCVLALAAALATGGVWLGIVGSSRLGPSLSAGMILPDMLWGQANSQTPHLTGRAGSATAPKEKLMAVQDNGPLRMKNCYAGQFHLKIYQPRVGANPVVVSGLPYGPLAFQRQRATLTLVPAGTTVYLLDARWALSALHGEEALARQVLAECARQGQVSLFHPGPLEAFVAVRAELRQAGVELPILCSTKPQARAMEPFWQAAGALRAVVLIRTAVPLALAAGAVDAPVLCSIHLQATGMEGLWYAVWALRAGPMVVITADEDLARAAAADSGKRYLVHLLSPGAEAASARLTVHSSLANLKEYLAARPIRR